MHFGLAGSVLVLSLPIYDALIGLHVNDDNRIADGPKDRSRIPIESAGRNPRRIIVKIVVRLLVSFRPEYLEF